LSTALGAIWEVPVQSKEESVMAKERMEKLPTLPPPTQSSRNGMNDFWMKCTTGRVGDCAVQDVSLSIKQMVALTELFEEDYKRVMRNKHRTPSQVREVLFPSALFSILVYRGLD
jgi:hypothetical protein